MGSQEGSGKPRLVAKGDGPAPVMLRRCLQYGRADAAWSQPGALCEACDATIAGGPGARPGNPVDPA